MDPFQFYPTYRKLADRAWAKFKVKKVTRLLEPSAGNGDLAIAMPSYDPPNPKYPKDLKIDCCELDISRHDALRAKGLTVVGVDFMEFGNGAIYSHCIMNPPFSEGAKHTLKAWDILWNAELVAILNAETIRNPYTKDRQRLVRLIEQYGEVEFVGEAFLDPETERRANVEVAIVYLKKVSEVEADFVGDLIADLRSDAEDGQGLSRDYAEFQQVALPKSAIENMVLTFNAAVVAMKDSVRTQARANYYANLIGDTMEVRSARGRNGADKYDVSVEYVHERMYAGYEDLKNRAWAGLLASSNVTNRLSTKAAKHIKSQFETIKKLEFTLSNIYGFLCGVIDSQGDIQIQMACDVFDEITCYHSDNVVFYKGWKSNDKHRTCGVRIKGTRFVLPKHEASPRCDGVGGNTLNLLSDFDKVFAMLDGKTVPEFGLHAAFEKHFKELCAGARISSSYFDVRYYPKAGTIHLFPRNTAMVDRLNRLVGRKRSWLPPESERVSDNFWLQYEEAEKFDEEVREIVRRESGLPASARGPLHFATSPDQTARDEPAAVIDAVLTTVLEKHGISTDYRIESAQDSNLLAA
jgi:hypothetical protein